MSLAATLLTPGVLELIPDAMVAVDKSGRIVQANSQAEKLFGYSPSELLGMAIEVLVPDRYRLGHSRHREEFTTHPKTRPMGSGLDLYAKRRDGSEFPVTISLSPVSTGSGMLVLSAIRDTSAQKK
ncbi:MAG TPA: PAS domain S-box protein, partial [Terriglobales bacterium]